MPAGEAQRWIEQASLLHDAGRWTEAEGFYRRALAEQPGRIEAQCGLGLLLSQLGRHSEALNFLDFEMIWRSGSALLLTAMGASLAAVGRIDEGVACAQRAAELAPENPAALFNFGCVLASGRRWAAAAEAYRQAIAIAPDYAQAWQNLGFALREMKRCDEAIAAFERAIALRPDYAETLHNLGVSLADAGRVKEGVDALKKSLAIFPANAPAHSALVYLMQFDPRAAAGDLASEEKRWGDLHASKFKSEWREFNPDRTPGRKLRIGYVSPDFRSHAECRFILPLFAHHDRGRFEIHCFSSVRRPDSVTAQIHELADRWHNVAQLSDEALAPRIREEKIDILIDLTMHMEDHRLLAFARRPAPVQMAWLAYPGGTGIAAMNYRITDRFLDPETEGDGGHVERALRLEDEGSWFCYQAPEEAPAVCPLPALADGLITFGSLNGFRKMSEEVAQLWARTMASVEKSGRGCRLLVISPEGEHRAGMQRIFAEHGIAPERVEFLPPMKYADYLAAYGRIDIALDPFPHNGATTTCDALWMGVPVLTLAGKTAPGRLGTSVLTAANMPEWIADSENKFIGNAVNFSGDLPKLAEWRSGLRERMQRSALMDAPGFAKRLESTFTWAWEHYLAGSGGK